MVLLVTRYILKREKRERQKNKKHKPAFLRDTISKNGNEY